MYVTSKSGPQSSQNFVTLFTLLEDPLHKMKCRSAVAEIGLRRPSVRPPLGWIETGGQTGQRGLIHNLHILHLGLD